MMQFRNAVYNASGTIDVEINHPFHGWIPFTASPDDVEPLGPEIFHKAKSSAKPYIAPPPPDQGPIIRAKRDALLSSSDWTQVADAPVDKEAWVIYRQALRDIPQQKGFPDNVVWPIKPE